jgi:FkbM family methyltransferase
MRRLRRIVKTAVAHALTAWRGDDEGLVPLTVHRGPARGLRLNLDLGTRQEFAYWLGQYDRPILERLQSVCRAGWTVWDCGTYLGFYTCVLARLVGRTGRVVAVEADPANLERTRRNAVANGFRNVVFVHAAVGGRSGETDLVVSRNTNSHLPGTWIGATRDAYARIEQQDAVIRVPAVTLDDVCYAMNLGRPHLVKLDIEGAEAEALAGAERLARDVRPLVVLELHNPECDLAAWRWAERFGYHLMSAESGRTIERSDEVSGTLFCTPRE